MPNKKKPAPAARTPAPTGYDFSAFKRSGGILSQLNETPVERILRQPTSGNSGPRRPQATIKSAPRATGTLTRLAATGVRRLSEALGSSERDAIQRAQNFEEANLEWNPFSQADQTGTQLRMLADGDKDFRKADLVHGALGSALAVGGEFVGPALGALSRTGAGKAAKAFLGKRSPAYVIDDTIDLPVAARSERTRRSTPDVRTASGAIVTPRVDQPGVLTSPGKMRPLRDEPPVELTHNSYQPALTETDPARLGSNPARITSREELRNAQHNPRTYFGVDTGKPGGYIGTRSAGQFEYRGTVPKHRMLETGSPGFEAIRDAAREILKTGDKRFGPAGPNGSVLMDTLAKNAGYRGVLYTPEASSLGSIAQVFDKVPVKRVTPTIPADFLPQNLDNAMTRDDWTIATGANPMGQAYPEEANRFRNMAFQEDVRGMGAEAYPVAGKYGQSEDSFLVSPVNQQQAVGLGERFEQDSVLTNRGLLMNDGSLVPAQGATAFETPPEDFFSSMPVDRLLNKDRNANFAVILGDFNPVPDPTRAARQAPQAIPKLEELDGRTLRMLARNDQGAATPAPLPDTARGALDSRLRDRTGRVAPTVPLSPEAVPAASTELEGLLQPRMRPEGAAAPLNEQTDRILGALQNSPRMRAAQGETVAAPAAPAMTPDGRGMWPRVQEGDPSQGVLSAAAGPRKASDSYAAWRAENDGPGDLFDYSNMDQVPDVPQAPMDRYQPPRGPSDRITSALANPKVAEGINSYVERGASLGGKDWYNTEPLRQKYLEALGPEKGPPAYARFMDSVAATSPRSTVPDNIRTASYYNYQRENGLPVTDKPAPGYGSVAQNLHASNMGKLVDGGGWDIMANPKPASFSTNLQGNQQNVTIDTHNMRLPGILSEDPRFLETSIQEQFKGGKANAVKALLANYPALKGASIDTAVKGMPEAGLGKVNYRPQAWVESGEVPVADAVKDPALWTPKPKDNEYGAYEDWQREQAGNLGMSPAQYQASMWVGAGDATGLASPPEPFLRTLEARVKYTADRLGLDPKTVLDNLVRGRAPLLSAGAGIGVLSTEQFDMLPE